MPSNPYRYRFRLTERTKEQLKLLDEDGWQRLFELVLRGSPVPYNIDFSEYDSLTRLRELYDIVMTLQLDPRPYQTALTRLLVEHYGNSNVLGMLYDLIRTVDYVRPGGFYNRLEQLVTKPEYANMLQTKAPDGYLIHFHLINAIMAFDTDRRLLNFLLALKEKEQLPEYYQVTIRYLYSYCGQAQFEFFMNGVAHRLSNDRIRTFVLNAFEEYVFYRREHGLVYLWLFHERARVADEGRDGAVLGLAREILAWLKGGSAEIRGYKGFAEIQVFLGALLRGEDSLTVDQLESLLHMDDREFYNRDDLIGYLGEQFHWFKVDRTPQGTVIREHTAQTNFLPDNQAKVVDLFENGTYKGTQKLFRSTSRSAFALPTADVDKSMRDDEQRKVNFGR